MFMMEPMRSIFGYRNDTEAAEQVLNGTFVPPDGTPEAGILLLEVLQRPHQAHDRSTSLPYASFRWGIIVRLD